jgi:cation diffusion facilitator family transporter
MVSGLMETVGCAGEEDLDSGVTSSNPPYCDSLATSLETSEGLPSLAMEFWKSIRHQIGHFFGDDHGTVDHDMLDTGEAGVRATKVSLIGLGLTAVLQAAIFVFSDSVALLSDTVHNLTDALTSIPLWVAFSMSRRRPTRTYTYGFNRVEDLAGLLIVVAIGASAVLVIWESAGRLIQPRRIDHIPWVIAAGVIGFLGNELVARYRTRVGRRIGSEALITDGSHAHTDALTSLAVVAAGLGAAFGAVWVDPVAGLMVGVAILWLLVRSARRMARRLLDGVDPEFVDQVASTIREVPAVDDVSSLQVRWQGHALHISASITVDPDLTVRAGHETAHDVEHALHHRFSFPISAVIHVEPHGVVDSHDSTAHHRG